MAPTTPPPSSPEFERVRALFERAMELPPEEREAFVRREAAHDPGLLDRVLRLLRADAEARTAELQDAARSSAGAAAGERVQSTATSDLLAKLEQAPRLDEKRYELQGEVDRGGMGAILSIHDRHLNRRLAMKVLLEREAPRDDYEEQLAHQILGRFLEEAQVTSQLDHPGVVPVHELGLDQTGRVYFTMRLIKGRTAHEVFAESHAGSHDWPLTRALEIVLKVCDTMAFAHDKGVLHRDLKPGNVMVGRFGEVYVMDWGLAKVLGQPDRRDLRIRPQASTVSAIDSAALRGMHGAVLAFLGEELRLLLKPRATILAPVAQGLPFLGWRIYRGLVRLRPENLRRTRRRLSLRARQFARGRIGELEYTDSVRAVAAHLMHGNTLQLRRRLFAEPAGNTAAARSLPEPRQPRRQLQQPRRERAVGQPQRQRTVDPQQQPGPASRQDVALPDRAHRPTACAQSAP